MKTIFKYNANAKYSAKDLGDEHNSKNFPLLDVYLDENWASVKIQLPNIFKDHHIVAKQNPTTVGCDEWSLSNSLWTKSYNSHGKCRPELNKYFYMYRYRLNFAMFVSQVHLVSLGNTRTIQTYLYALFIDFMCVLMYD